MPVTSLPFQRHKKSKEQKPFKVGVPLCSQCCTFLPCQNWDDPAEPEGEEEPHSQDPEIEEDVDEDLGGLVDGVADPEGDASPLVIEDSQPEPEDAGDEMEPLAGHVADGSPGPGEEAIPASTDAVRGSDSEMQSDPSESEPSKVAFETGEETVDRKPVKVQVFGESPASERFQAIQRMLQNARQRRQAMMLEVGLNFHFWEHSTINMFGKEVPRMGPLGKDIPGMLSNDSV